MKSLRLSAIFLVLVIAWPALAWSMTLGEEAKLGRQFKIAARQIVGFVPDPVLDDYLATVGQALAAQAGPMNFKPTFYLAAKNQLNAFAGPGAVIVITQGLAAAMDSVDELAGVLGHELAHVTERHLAEQMDQAGKVGLATMAGILAGVLIGVAGGSPEVSQAITLGSIAAGESLMLSYSREQELEADQVGVRYLTGARYDLQGILTTLERIKQAAEASGGEPPPYLSTHPALTERISFLGLLQPQASPLPDRPGAADWPWFKARLMAEREEGARYFQGLSGPEADYGQGLMALGAGRLDEALAILGRIYKGHPRALGAAYSYAQALRQAGRQAEAVEVLRRRLPSKPDDRGALFLLGQIYLELDQPDKALRFLKELSVLTPDEPSLLHALGVAYGRLGQLVQAHLSLGWANTYLGQRTKALKNFDLAIERAGQGSEKERATKERAEALELLEPFQG